MVTLSVSGMLSKGTTTLFLLTRRMMRSRPSGHRDGGDGVEPLIDEVLHGAELRGDIGAR